MSELNCQCKNCEHAEGYGGFCDHEKGEAIKLLSDLARELVSDMERIYDLDPDAPVSIQDICHCIALDYAAVEAAKDAREWLRGVAGYIMVHSAFDFGVFEKVLSALDKALKDLEEERDELSAE
jgi:hypothetical protein